MRWQDYLEVDESGKVFYKGVEVELRCENILNLAEQGVVRESLEKEVRDFIRDLKIDIVLGNKKKR